MEFRKIDKINYADVSRIYMEGVVTRLATYETEAPSWEDWDKNHLKICRIAIYDEEEMAGWVALTPVSNRCVYDGVAELSIYIANKYRGKGVGKKILQYLIEESEKAGIWMLQSGIFPENEASVKLHKACGFRLVGYREKIGKLDGVWKDVYLMERRSKVVGV